MSDKRMIWIVWKLNPSGKWRPTDVFDNQESWTRLVGNELTRITCHECEGPEDYDRSAPTDRKPEKV